MARESADDRTTERKQRGTHRTPGTEEELRRAVTLNERGGAWSVT
jgi:hypothetical protein